MSKIVRAISEDGSVMVSAINSTEIVAEMEQIHKTSAVVTAALGRLTTAASIMGNMLKSEKQSITIQLRGDGKAGVLMAVSDFQGNVKSYVENPIVEIPLNQYGKLDVATAVGTNGYVNVIRDMGTAEPYIGQTAIVSGEVAEDITHYYANSEQTPTVCGLGVLVNPNLTVKAAGGYLVQLLPHADEGCIDLLEENVEKIPPVSQLFATGMTPEDVCMELLSGLNPNVLDTFTVSYRCDCSRKRVERALISLGAEELANMITEQEETKAHCQFCNKEYVFDKNNLETLLKTAK